MTASIRSLRSFFASTCKPSLWPGSVASLLLMIGVVCVPHAGAVPLTASFSGGFEVLGVPLTYPSGIAVDASENVYLAMPALSLVQEIPAGCASSGCIATLGGGFSYPTGVAVDGSSNIYVTDEGYSQVIKVAPGCENYSCGTILGGGFSAPFGVAVDANGNVFVADTYNAEVKEITAASGYTTVKELVHGTFSLPSGLAVDGAGNVYVSDSNSGSVYEITAASNYTSVTTLNSSLGTCVYGIAVDGSGNIFVAECDANDVKEITLASGYTAVNTLAPSFGSFNSPLGLAVDAGGNVYVASASYAGAEVHVIAAAGGYSTVTQLTSGDISAFGLALTPVGNLFVSDFADERVIKLDVSAAPSLHFNKTAVGFISADSPQTVTVINDGNASLSFSSLSYAHDFPEDNSNAGACSTSTPLGAGDICTLPIDFTPVGTYPYSTQFLSENLSLTDNSLNVLSTTQSLSLSGTANAPGISFTSPGSTTLTQGTVGVSYGSLGSVSFTATSGLAPYTYASP